MKYISLVILFGSLVTLGGCMTAQPIEFEQEPSAPIQTVEQEEPTLESEIPVTTDEEIVTQGDTSL